MDATKEETQENRTCNLCNCKAMLGRSDLNHISSFCVPLHFNHHRCSNSTIIFPILHRGVCQCSHNSLKWRPNSHFRIEYHWCNKPPPLTSWLFITFLEGWTYKIPNRVKMKWCLPRVHNILNLEKLNNLSICGDNHVKSNKWSDLISSFII